MAPIWNFTALSLTVNVTASPLHQAATPTCSNDATILRVFTALMQFGCYDGFGRTNRFNAALVGQIDAAILTVSTVPKRVLPPMVKSLSTAGFRH